MIDYSSTKLFQPRKSESNDKNFITFTKTHNPDFNFLSINLGITWKTQQIEKFKNI